MSSCIEFDTSECQTFFSRLVEAASGDFKNAMTEFMEGLGFEFLRILQDEIVRRNVMDSRLLLASFEKGDQDNVWLISEGGLTLEIGTNVKYAAFVNNGHMTNPEGVESRFIPGTWQGDRFVYEPGADEGMILKQRWVAGAHYWESALKILEKIYPKLLEAKLNDWLQDYFADFI